MFGRAKEVYETTVREIREAGLYKEERVIVTPQSAEIGVGTGMSPPPSNFHSSFPVAKSYPPV